VNTLDRLIPKIKRNIKKFKKPGVLAVRPGFCVENGWPTKEEAIVALMSRHAKKVKLPSKIEGTTVDARTATDLEQFSHDQPDNFSAVADHRAELRGTSILPEFSPSTGAVKSPISAKVTAARKKKIPLQYVAANVPLTPVAGKIPIVCHVSPDAGWPSLVDFLSKTKNHLKVSIYDFTSEHILKLFENHLKGSKVQMTIDDPPKNPSADQADPVTVTDLKSSLATKFSSAWALVESSPEADSWMFPTAYHIKVMVRDSDTVWLSSGNLNNSNQPEMDPINNPKPSDQATAKGADRDWHVIIESKQLAETFEAYLDTDFQQATLHAATTVRAAKTIKKTLQTPKLASIRQPMGGDFNFVAPVTVSEQMTITPLLTPDTGVYQTAILALIKSVQHSLYIQLQYIHPTNDATKAKFTELIDAVAGKIHDNKDVRIILSEFQVLKGGLDALQAAGIDLTHVKIQNNVHNKGFVFDHKIVVVSSMNWSGEGVLSNRDAGVIIENATAAQYYEKIFLDDWANHAQQKIPPTN
jgi:phosphatidylserine/phosphatidylglycerophosphate/cardiolipin synthase-like enzyme